MPVSNLIYGYTRKSLSNLGQALWTFCDSGFQMSK